MEMERLTPAPQTALAEVVGRNAHMGMMILALATSQSRAPRHKHGGRHNNPMERPCPPPSEQPLNIKCEDLHPHRPMVRILS